MLQFSPSKINIGLYITGKRKDGYHNLESIFLPIAFYDGVELIPSEKNELFTYGKSIPGNPKENSCLKSLELMHEKYNVGSYKIHLMKNVPMGAGLGGGSANSAAVIQLVNQLEALNLSSAQMQELALQIGSDNAFFIDSSAKHVSGRGDVLKKCNLSLSGYKIVLIIPPIHQSTREAYKDVTYLQPDFELQKITEEQLLNGSVKPLNSFQEGFSNRFPESIEIVGQLEENGAFFSSLSGTGSAFYGLFTPGQSIPLSLMHFAKQKNYYYKETRIL